MQSYEGARDLLLSQPTLPRKLAHVREFQRWVNSAVANRDIGDEGGELDASRWARMSLVMQRKPQGKVL